MKDGVEYLKARPIREVSASCGCVLIWVLAEAVDANKGHFVSARELVCVPCSFRDEHVEVMRAAITAADAADEVIELEHVVEEFERLIGGHDVVQA